MPKLYYVTASSDDDGEGATDLILVANDADEAFALWSDYYALDTYAGVNDGETHPLLNTEKYDVFEGPEVPMPVGLIKWHSPDGFQIVETREQLTHKAAHALGVTEEDTA